MATMATGVIAAFVVLLSVVAEKAAAAAEPPSTRGGCTDELLSFSACLSYVSSPPNNLTDTPSATCCDAFSSAVESGGGLCLCYFVRYPNILGFPLNTARLLSLSSICAPPPSPPLSLNFLCSAASPALPPLNSAATLGFTKPGSSSGSGSRGGGGRSSGRMAPKFGGRRSPGSSRGNTVYYLPVPNGPVAASTHFCSTNTLLLSPLLPILLTLPLLSTV